MTKVISSYINMCMSDIKDFLALPDDVKKHFQEIFKKKLNHLLFDEIHNLYYDNEGIVTVEQYKTMKLLSEV